MLRLLFIFLFFTVVVQAQQDSIHILREVDISERRLNMMYAAGTTDSIENTTAIKLSAGNLSTQLEREANVFVRNYGTSNLSTVSIRGGSSSQTAILWNGLQVQSPMLGVYDLKLLPAFLSGTAQVRYGGCSPSTGSGAMTGALLMNSSADIHKGYEVNLFSGIGEYGHYQGGVGLDLGTQKLSSSTRVYYQQSENNFRYVNVEEEVVDQNHASFDQAGIAQDLRWESKIGRIDVHGFYINYHHEIPPHMLTSVSKQEQDDEALRLAASWQYTKDRWNYQVRSGWSKENITFKDPAAKLDEFSTATIFQPEAQVNFKTNDNWLLTMEAGAVISRAEVESYDPDLQSSDQATISAAAIYEKNRWFVQGVLRAGVFNGDALPLLPSVMIYRRNNKWPSIRMEASSIYRNPTLNDLYWKPGGNEALKPESGFMLSASLEKKISEKSIYSNVRAGIFYSDMKELLTWIPDASGIFHASNLQRVESKGIEIMMNARTCFSKVNFRITASAQFNPAILKESSQAMSSGIDEQLVYTPKIMAKGQAEVSFKTFALRYFHSYTGYRYVTQDHSQYLEPFAVGEFILSWDGYLNKSGITLFVNLKNCWDEAYQVIAWRAMPGRYLESGINITFGSAGK